MVIYNGDNLKIKNAIHVFNQEGFKNSLIEKILNHDKFTHTEVKNAQIVVELVHLLSIKTISIEIYYPRWRWSKALGYFSKSKPYTININGYKIGNLKVESIVGLIAHETTHMASAASEYKFDHGSNNPKGKHFSAPYSIGRMAKQLTIEAKQND